MTTADTKRKIESLITEMLNESYETMLKNVDKILNSGCLDIESWDENNKPMFLPKCVVSAIVMNEGRQYQGKGTGYEKRIKKEVENIKFFL